MSAIKILLGLFTLAVVVIMIGHVTMDPVVPLHGSSNTLTGSKIIPDNSIELNLLLNKNGFRAGYSTGLSIEQNPDTYTVKNGKTFVLARGRRCTKMVPFL
jgi:hypothetical protein